MGYSILISLLVIIVFILILRLVLVKRQLREIAKQMEES